MTEDDKLGSAREHIHAAIQETAALHHHPGDEGDPERKILIGWSIVAEWMSPTGERLLWSESGGSNGDRLPRWQTAGYLHSTLFPEWDAPDEGEEEPGEDED